MQRWLRLSFFAVTATGILLLIFAAAGGATSPGFERFFPTLIAINVLTTLVLFYLLLRLGLQFWRSWRQRAFGSRMSSRLALTIAAIAVIPCLLLYLVSAQFIGRSIDSWFDVRIERALDEGVSLTSRIIENERNRLLFATRRAAMGLAEAPQEQWDTTIEKIREDYEANVALIFQAKGNIVCSSMAPESQLKVDIPLAPEFQDALKRNGFSLLEGETSAAANDPMRIRTLVPVFPNEPLNENFFLQFSLAVPPSFAEGAQGLVEGYKDYQELTLSRDAMRAIYRITLTLTMVLILFAALVVALWFARSMTEPVMQLALGTKKVANGDLVPIREFPGNDEINALTQSFNSMVTQIAEAQQIVENQRLATERSRAYLESVLANISAGVLVLDESLNILLANNGAITILETNSLRPGDNLSQVEPALSQAIIEKIRIADTDSFHVDLELERQKGGSAISLFIRGSRLALEGAIGWVVAFDDVSAVIDAQKAQAWNEVARRLAHEIKNPLTPIRLAAERLCMKLESKLEDKDAALLNRATSTIIGQVDAMKKMVNDFRDFAKLPPPTLLSIDINEIIEDMIAFYRSAGLAISGQLQQNLPSVLADAAQLRQVLFNLIGNASEACADLAAPQILISTQAVSRGESTSAVRLLIEDNGPGFPPNVLVKAFEPYVTTKATGTGLGLPMVKKIVEEHRAKIVLENILSADGAVSGARVSIVFPVEEIRDVD